MIGYECGRCPLAFEVGYYGYWDLSGGCVKYVCRHCGTMHKTEHVVGQPDLLYSLAGPIRGMVEETIELNGETHTTRHLSIADSDWRLLGPLPTADEFVRGLFILPDRIKASAVEQAVCGHCNKTGSLGSGKLSKDGGK